MSYYISSCVAPPKPVCNPCWVKEEGRVRSIALINNSLYETNPNWEDPNVWENGVCANTIYLFPFVNGELTVTEKLSNDYGDVPEGVDSFEFAINGAEPQIQNNLPFWNAVTYARNYIVAYRTQSLLWVASAPAMIFAKAPVANVITEKVDIKLMLKWIQGSNPTPIAVPAGIFNQCVDC